MRQNEEYHIVHELASAYRFKGGDGGDSLWYMFISWDLISSQHSDVYRKYDYILQFNINYTLGGVQI